MGMTNIKFGTSGWRAILADEFTFENVRRAVQATATYFRREIEKNLKNQPVIVGYDPRFLSPEFARTAAEGFAAQGLSVLLSKDVVPTPAVSFQILHQKAIGSVNFTASHNPAEYNGFKVNMASGAPASPEMTKEIERLANDPTRDAETRDLGMVSSSPVPESLVRLFDPKPAYMAKLRKMVDMGVLKKAKLKVGADCLYGAGMGYLDEFLKASGCRTTVLHHWRDVRFGGLSPEPGNEQLAELFRVMKKERLQIGLATDGDADRFGIVDDDGTLLWPNDILPILLQHLVRTRKAKGLVVRSVMTSHFIDAVAKHYDLPMRETPVGFKYIAEAMAEGGFLMGGEESGGLTIDGHVPEKDGILACLLMAEVRAVQKKPFRQILKELRAQVGPYFSERINLHLTQEAMQSLRKRLETFTPNSIGHFSVKKIVRLDGFKFIFQDDSWMGIRLSGTEPVVRLYVEAASPKKLKEVKQVGRQLIEN